MVGEAPLIRLDPEGRSPLLGYDVPEPTTYDGRNLIRLDLLDDEEDPTDLFEGAAFAVPDAEPPSPGRSGPARLPVRGRPTPGNRPWRRRVGADLAVDPAEVAAELQSGRRLVVYRSLFGRPAHTYVDTPPEPAPAIYLVESVRLATFLGDYGAGRVVKTFTLLPGESTQLSVKTYKRTEESAKSSSSILDSFTEESADDFESSIAEEQSDSGRYAETFEYYADAEASASWGWGSARVKGGVKGGTTAAREEFRKNVVTATRKHAAKASAKREVTVETSYETREQEGEESSIERRIENVNLSRTLNFVFRQMNQEFITLLTLVDVRVAFFNGFAESRREVPLSGLDDLLATHVKADRRAEVRSAVLAQLTTVLDHRDEVTSLIEERALPGGRDDTFWRTRKDLLSTYEAPGSDLRITVPGIILDASSTVMRTDGVIVESLLGAGDALDDYARELQELEVGKRRAEVEQGAARARLEELVARTVEDGDADRAALLARLFEARRGRDDEP